MPLTAKEYDELGSEMGTELEAFVDEARAALQSLLVPLTAAEDAEATRLSPLAYDKALDIMPRLYEPLRDVTIENDGFPAWSELSFGQRKAVVLRAMTDPDGIRRTATRAAMILASNVRRGAEALLKQTHTLDGKCNE